jgi:glycosyltransferase involved in cell wall biosynthesis
MLSVLILTLNEEASLPRCLESVSWSDDIVVLDSFSSDRTVEIARAAGARVVQRVFDDWSSHQNWAVNTIDFKHPWVYYSDADEVVPSDLREELLAVSLSASSTNLAAYRLRYRNFFMGKWLRHCGIYPTWILRLYQPSKIRWERSVNPTPVVDGEVGRLRSHFNHYSFSKGLEAWFAKHNRYSTQEADESLRSLHSSKRIDWRDLLSPDAPRRKAALKELSFRLPFRPSLRFTYMYVLRCGFLDGIPGLTYCRLLAIYEYMIVVKMTESRRREKGLPI